MLEQEEILQQVEWLLSEGEPEKASQLCRRGLKRYPRNHELWLLLGDSLLDSGLPSQADRAFKNASEIRKHWSLPLAKRAEALLMEGRLRFARTLSNRAYETDRDCAHSTYLKGMILDVEGRWDVARFFYYRAARLDPEGYFPPVAIAFEKFSSLALEVLEVLGTSPGMKVIRNTRWEILPEVEPQRSEMKDVSPIAPCVILHGEPGEPEDILDHSEAWRGFIFWRNVIRQCRTVDELKEHLILVLQEELIHLEHILDDACLSEEDPDLPF